MIFHMHPSFIRKIKTLVLICLLTSIAGVIYQLINEKLVNYNSIFVGLPLGLVFCLLELFLFPKAENRFRKWSFTKMLI
jgi:hypothetical protein